MAEMMLAIGSSIASAASSVGTFIAANPMLVAGGINAVGSIYEGVNAQQNADIMAKQLKAKGDDEMAASQREAMKRRKESTLANSRNIAVAAASGAGVDNPTVTDIMSDVEAQGAYNALTEMYRGRVAKSELDAEAATTKMKGRQAMIGSLLDAGGSIYSGFAQDRRARQRYAEP